MNVFQEVVAASQANDTKLGMPSTDDGHFQRRMDLMSAIRGGKGFRTFSADPKKRANGMTRGEMKRAARETVNSRVSEHRDPQFMHSAARRRLSAPEMKLAA